MDIPSGGLRDKCASQPRQSHPLLPPLPPCGDDFLASQTHTVGPHCLNALRLRFLAHHSIRQKLCSSDQQHHNLGAG